MTNLETHIEIINTNSGQPNCSSLAHTDVDLRQTLINVSEITLGQVYRLFFSDKSDNYCSICGKQLLSAIQVKFHAVNFHDAKKINFEQVI